MKLSLVVICGCLLPLGVVVNRGPRYDTSEATELLDKASAKARPKRLFADRGYDAERVHES
ncbi:MAG: hypothetical protein K2X87_16970 [Gemmataceae bacterium]|nr:hypothetical protein [Gemmataceae bacterium]